MAVRTDRLHSQAGAEAPWLWEQSELRAVPSSEASHPCGLVSPSSLPPADRKQKCFFLLDSNALWVRKTTGEVSWAEGTTAATALSTSICNAQTYHLYRACAGATRESMEGSACTDDVFGHAGNPGECTNRNFNLVCELYKVTANTQRSAVVLCVSNSLKIKC